MSSPVSSRPLKLSSAIITADGGLEPGRLLHLEVWISARVLSELEIMLATTDKPEEAADSPAEIPAAERLEMHTNSILLSSLPDVLHLSGRSHGTHHDEAAERSYTLTLTFSDEGATSMSWSTTFEVIADSSWRLTVPFSHSLTPVAVQSTNVE